MTFQPRTDLLTDRSRAERAVARCLENLRRGALPSDAERQHVDVKEEAGRRGAGGRLQVALVVHTLLHRPFTTAEQMARVLQRTPGEAAEAPALVVNDWLFTHDRITSGDYAALTGLTTAGARRTLDRLVEDTLLVRGDVAGRNAHYLRTR